MCLIVSNEKQADGRQRTKSDTHRYKLTAMCFLFNDVYLHFLLSIKTNIMFFYFNLLHVLLI